MLSSGESEISLINLLSVVSQNPEINSSELSENESWQSTELTVQISHAYISEDVSPHAGAICQSSKHVSIWRLIFLIKSDYSGSLPISSTNSDSISKASIPIISMVEKYEIILSSRAKKKTTTSMNVWSIVYASKFLILSNQNLFPLNNSYEFSHLISPHRCWFRGDEVSLRDLWRHRWMVMGNTISLMKWNRHSNRPHRYAHGRLRGCVSILSFW